MEKNKKKTIIFLMSRLPFPAVSGRKKSLYHYCRILSEELGFRLVVAAFPEKNDIPENPPGFIDRLVILPEASNGRKILSVIKDSLILQKYPMQVALFWNTGAKKVVDELFREEQPIAVIADMIRTTEYIKDLPVKRIADLDDRISLRFKRQMNIAMDNLNPYGAYLQRLPAILRKILLSCPIKCNIIRKEIALLEKYEKEICLDCDYTVFVAASEAEEINRELGVKKAMAIPIGVDTEYFFRKTRKTEKDVIGFLGALNVTHNESAVKLFIEKIFPKIKTVLPDVKFWVIGGGITENLIKYASDDVNFVGRVDDVRDYLEKCSVFVCPMQFGSGVKTKILEAMAMEIPVVTSSIGAENIGAINGKDWIIENDPKKFANQVCDLLKNPDKRETMGRNGRAFVKQNWNWNIAKKKFKKILEVN